MPWWSSWYNRALLVNCHETSHDCLSPPLFQMNTKIYTCVLPHNVPIVSELVTPKQRGPPDSRAFCPAVRQLSWQLELRKFESEGDRACRLSGRTTAAIHDRPPQIYLHASASMPGFGIVQTWLACVSAAPSRETRWRALSSPQTGRRVQNGAPLALVMADLSANCI